MSQDSISAESSLSITDQTLQSNLGQGSSLPLTLDQNYDQLFIELSRKYHTNEINQLKVVCNGLAPNLSSQLKSVKPLNGIVSKIADHLGDKNEAASFVLYILKTLGMSLPQNIELSANYDLSKYQMADYRLAVLKFVQELSNDDYDIVLHEVCTKLNISHGRIESRWSLVDYMFAERFIKNEQDFNAIYSLAKRFHRWHVISEYFARHNIQVPDECALPCDDSNINSMVSCGNEDSPSNSRMRPATANGKTCRHILQLFLIICILILLGVLAYLAFVISKLMISVNPLTNYNLIVRGDYARLHGKTMASTSYMYEIEFKLWESNKLINDDKYDNNYTSTTIKEVDIFELACDTLDDHYEVMPINIPERKPKMMNFDNCSESESVCFLDKFYYEIDVEFSTLSYIVTLDSFASDTIVQIIAFDDLRNLNSYMDSRDVVNPVKAVNMSNRIYEFTLTPSEMRTSSYYFVIIENMKGHAKEFTSQACGIHVYYNGSLLTGPICTLSTNTTHLANQECTRKITNASTEICYVGHFKKSPGLNSITDDQPQNDHLYVLSISRPVRTHWGKILMYGIQLGSAVFFTMLFVLCILLISCCLCYVQFYCNPKYERLNQDEI